MNENQYKERMAANKAFMDSLHKLQETLQSDEGQNPKVEPEPPVKKVTKKEQPEEELLLSALEEAAADIEQFMQSHETENEKE